MLDLNKILENDFNLEGFLQAPFEDLQVFVDSIFSKIREDFANDSSLPQFDSLQVMYHLLHKIGEGQYLKLEQEKYELEEKLQQILALTEKAS